MWLARQRSGRPCSDGNALMARFILVRHTQPAIAAGVCYGRLDLDLASTWLLDFEESLRRIPAAARIVSSPALRCRLAEAMGRRVSSIPPPGQRN
jgi:hypothetical protein